MLNTLIGPRVRDWFATPDCPARGPVEHMKPLRLKIRNIAGDESIVALTPESGPA